MFKKYIIQKNCKIIDALKKMDEYHSKLLLVLSEQKFYSMLSIGDIQRGIINGVSLEDSVTKILRKKVKYANKAQDINDIKKLMINHRMEFCPVIDENKNIVKVHFWSDLFGNENKNKGSFNLPVVIMAGGLGTRLRPLTNVLPKPLLPIGEKTIIENIMQRFSEHGCNEFIISLNYKSDFIKHYIEMIKLKHNLNYVVEKKAMGTAGSLNLIKKHINSTFFVSNCDILIDEDYSEVLKYHNENGNDITIISALKNYMLPYGSIRTKSNGVLSSIDEKPNITFQVNTGMYILERHVLEHVPKK